MWKCNFTCNPATVEIPGKLSGGMEPPPAREVDATFRIAAQIAQHLTGRGELSSFN